MKFKNIKIVIIVFILSISSWLLPYLFNIITAQAPDYPFVYYSSVVNKFCKIYHNGERLVRENQDGKEYTVSELDSILPMLYSAQLFFDNKFPNEINGKKINRKLVEQNKFFYKYKAAVKNSPKINLFPLFESLSGRVNLKMPTDVFRIKNKIEFIDCSSNTINKEKSKIYNDIFIKKGFKFPAKQVAGIPNTKKNFDEGYFIIDNEYKVYHMKMVNGMPFIKKTPISVELKTQHIEAIEFNKREAYGFLFDKHSNMYMITSDDYQLKQIKTPTFDLNINNLTIMGNYFYWNVFVTNNDFAKYFVLDAQTKEKVDELTIANTNKKTELDQYIFPFTLQFKSYSDSYIFPRFDLGSCYVLLINLLLFLISLFFIKFKLNIRKNLTLLIILPFGIYGLISVVLYKLIK